MTDAECVEFALVALRKRGEAVFFLDRGNAIAPPGEDLVRIALMTDVPDQTIVRRLEKIVQRDREFDHAEPCAEVTAGASDGFDQIFTQFTCNLGQLGFAETAQ